MKRWCVRYVRRVGGEQNIKMWYCYATTRKEAIERFRAVNPEVKRIQIDFITEVV